MTVDVIVDDPRWAEAVELSALGGRACAAALSDQGFDPDDHEIVLLACDDARIARLNADFRGKAGPTNVLSFPSVALAPGESAPEELGNVAIAFDTCAREAAEQGKPFDAHVAHLIVHAALHLLGHDHEGDAEAEAMEAAERRILRALGVPDPYAEDIS